jgi:hypothetical protein
MGTTQPSGRLHVPSRCFVASLLSLLILHRLLVTRFVRRQTMGEELLEQIGIMSLSNVWVAPVIALPVSTVPDCREANPKGRKAGCVLDSIDEVDSPGG